MATTKSCSACEHWKPEHSDKRMLRQGFAKCAQRKLPGLNVSSCHTCQGFISITPAKAAARAELLAASE